METLIETLEQQLDSFNQSERKEALEALLNLVKSGEVGLPESNSAVNLHLHSFYSYNVCGYSPSKIAWLARKAGLAVVGMVDFDVLDGLEEFLGAARLLGLKACVGLETRVYVPEFSHQVINSPGEPGIAYHVGIGFPRAELQDVELDQFKTELRRTAQQRNRELILRVNRYLHPVEIDYEQDVCPLTPSGSTTERHICLAYARKARTIFRHDHDLAEYWADRLGMSPEHLELPEGITLLNRIREKTMKIGGVGYVQPEAGLFPEMHQTNHFILTAGGMPTLAWLDGTSPAEQSPEKLLEIATGSGVTTINIIPARNYTPGLGEKDVKCRELYRLVKLAEEMYLPVIVGTEMNSPGQKFVDDFKSAELAPLISVFLKGAHIVYAHSVLQRQCGLGYTSLWAEKNFNTTADKNKFFEKVGILLDPQQEDLLGSLPREVTPQQILERINSRK